MWRVVRADLVGDDDRVASRHGMVLVLVVAAAAAAAATFVMMMIWFIKGCSAIAV